VVIRERTNEIGVRRSIGASPGRITSQIVLEALTLTLVAGYSGLLFGMLLLEAISNAGVDGAFFAKPEISLSTALIALAVLMVSGVLAGLFPARRALAIRVVDALRADK
jgi:putative ABC transport system permease protein